MWPTRRRRRRAADPVDVQIAVCESAHRARQLHPDLDPALLRRGDATIPPAVADAYAALGVQPDDPDNPDPADYLGRIVAAFLGIGGLTAKIVPAPPPVPLGVLPWRGVLPAFSSLGCGVLE